MKAELPRDFTDCQSDADEVDFLKVITKTKSMSKTLKRHSGVDVDKACAEVRSRCNKLTDGQRSILNEKARALFHGVRSKVTRSGRR